MKQDFTRVKVCSCHLLLSLPHALKYYRDPHGHKGVGEMDYGLQTNETFSSGKTEILNSLLSYKDMKVCQMARTDSIKARCQKKPQNWK